MKYFFYLVTLFLVFSCQNKEKSSETIIKINLNDAISIETNQLFSKIEIIPLETKKSSLEKQVIKSTVYKDSIFALFTHGQSFDNIVYLFNSDGSFLRNSTDKKGIGEVGYDFISEIEMNPFNSTCDFLDFRNHIMIHDENLTLIKDIDLNENRMDKEKITVHYLKPVNSNLYIISNAFEGNTFLFSVSQNRIIKETTMPRIKHYYLSSNYNPYYILDNRIFYNTIFMSRETLEIEIIADSMKTKHHLIIDYGDKNVPDNFFDSYHSGYDGAEALMNSKEFALPFAKSETKNYFVIYTLYKDSGYLTFYSKASKEITTYNVSFNQMNVPEFFYTTEEAMCCLVERKNIVKHINLNLLDEESKKRLENISEENNLVVIKYYFICRDILK